MGRREERGEGKGRRWRTVIRGDCPVLIVAGLPVVVPCPNVFIRCGNPLPSHCSALPQTAQLERTRADLLAEEGSTGKAPSSGPPGTKDAASNLSSLRLSWPAATVNTQSPLQGGKIKYLIKIFGC